MYVTTETAMAAAAATLNGFRFPSSMRVESPFLHLRRQAQFQSFSLGTSKLSASKSPTVPPKKRSSSSSNTNKTNKKNTNKSNRDSTSTSLSSLPQPPTPLPKPPSGFTVDQRGNVLTASKDRLATLVDPANNLPLECVIRRVFTSSQGDDCVLLCPADMPVQILQSASDGWSDVSGEELESILPAAAYALAKIRMYLVHSGYCYTARGGFCYSEEDIFDFHTDGTDDGLPTEGVEITHFNTEGAHYMIYTPSDPLLFVALKDQNGVLQIADDELLEDPAVISAIDEETEFNALVEEEAALRDSLLGKR